MILTKKIKNDRNILVKFIKKKKLITFNGNIKIKKGKLASWKYTVKKKHELISWKCTKMHKVKVWF